MEALGAPAIVVVGCSVIIAMSNVPSQSGSSWPENLGIGGAVAMVGFGVEFGEIWSGWCDLDLRLGSWRRRSEMEWSESEMVLRVMRLFNGGSVSCHVRGKRVDLLAWLSLVGA
jgi:hypothetical protein